MVHLYSRTGAFWRFAEIGRSTPQCQDACEVVVMSATLDAEKFPQIFIWPGEGGLAVFSLICGTFWVLMLSSISGWVAHYNLTAQASRLSNYILQRSFFSFARMSCSEQRTFYGQAYDRVWSFPNCSFKASFIASKWKQVNWKADCFE